MVTQEQLISIIIIITSNFRVRSGGLCAFQIVQPFFAKCILLHLHSDAEAGSTDFTLAWLTSMELKLCSVASPVVSSLKPRLHICSAVLLSVPFPLIFLPQSCLPTSEQDRVLSL